MFVGMDVHRNRTQVCVVDNKGKELRNRNVVNDRKVPARELSGLRKGTGVAFEAAYGVGWVAELCEELGLEPHLAHAAGCRAIADAKLKYDRLDARTLANLLRSGYLAEAWLAPAEVREQRLLLRQRAWLVRLRTAAKNRIRAQLANEGIPVGVSLWTRAGTQWLEGLEMSVMHRWTVADCQALIALLDERHLLARGRDPPSSGTGQAGGGAPGHSGHRAVVGHDTGGRNRRHRPLPHRPKALRLGRAHPGHAQLRPQAPPRPHHQSRSPGGPSRAR